MTEPELEVRPVVVAEITAWISLHAYVMLTPDGIVNEDAIAHELADAIDYHAPRCSDFEPFITDTDAMLAMVDGGNDGRRHVIIEVKSRVINTHPDPTKIDFDVQQTEGRR